MPQLQAVDSFAYVPVRPLHETASLNQLGLILGLLSQAARPVNMIASPSGIPSLIPALYPFILMMYFVIGCSSFMIVFLSTIIRSHSAEYAAPAPGLFLGPLWFQLPLSPQALELILYLGILLLFVKMI